MPAAPIGSILWRVCLCCCQHEAALPPPASFRSPPLLASAVLLLPNRHRPTRQGPDLGSSPDSSSLPQQLAQQKSKAKLPAWGNAKLPLGKLGLP